MHLAYHAARQPHQMAVHTETGSRTFEALNQRANQLARAFSKTGLVPDDAVAVLLSNRCEFLEVFYACCRTGLRFTPINWHLTGDDAAYILNDCEAKVFVTESRFTTNAIKAAHDASRVVMALDVDGKIEGFESYSDAIESESGSDIESPTIGSYMLYTSGTTGRPKGVYRDRGHPVFVDPVPPPSPLIYDPTSDVALCTGPAYHAAPLVLNIIDPINKGVGIVLMDKWNAEKALQLISEFKITYSHMVATMFNRMLDLPVEVRDKYDVSSMRFLLHGAAPCPVETKRQMIDWFGPVIFEYYSSTEGGGGFLIGSEEWLSKPGSVGKCHDPASTKILDESHEEVSPGEVGTIFFRAPDSGRFVYFKDEEKTSSSYLGEFFTLGDMGYLDGDGYLFLTGRSAEIIISGGVNIYPQEIDDVLQRHPAVLDVCTVGVPNDEWGEEVKSVIQLQNGHAKNDSLIKEILQFAEENIASFKRPRSVEFVDDLPRLPSGKIQRRLVKDLYWQGRDKKI